MVVITSAAAIAVALAVVSDALRLLTRHAPVRALRDGLMLSARDWPLAMHDVVAALNNVVPADRTGAHVQGSHSWQREWLSVILPACRPSSAAC